MKNLIILLALLSSVFVFAQRPSIEKFGITFQDNGRPTTYLADGHFRYDATAKKFEFYNGTAWVDVSSATEVNDLSSVVTWANVPNANITETSITQHEAALSITESQISDLSHTTDTNIDITTLAKLNAIVTDATLADGAHTTDTTLTLIDDDTMATATASNVPSGESIKAYVDGVVPTISNSVLVTLVTTAETVTETNVEDGVLFHQTSGANTVTVDPMALTYSGDAWFLMFKNTSGSDMTIANGAGVTGASHVISSNDFLTLFSEADDVWQKYNGSVAGGSESTTVSDTAEIDLTLSGSDISGIIVASSIDETKLDASTNASLDLADSASQGAHTTDTNLTDEEVQDKAGAMVSGNTESLITVTYQDADGTIDYVVDNDLANYSNATSNFSTGAHTVDTNLDINTLAKLNAIVVDATLFTGAHTVDTDNQVASEVPNTPSGNLIATDVQGALNELQTEVDGLAAGGDGLGSDGDKGDITVGGTGTTLQIDAAAITETELNASINASLDLADTSSQGAHTTDTNTQLSDAQVATAATNEGFVTGAHTVDTNTQLSISSVATIDTGTNNTEAISPLGLAGSQLQTDVTANNAKVTNAFTAGDETKLDGIATGATVNDTDANLKARANHTGTQTAATISDFDTEVSNNASVTANTAKVSYTDAAKVAGIEALADVTDTANVTTAGALMDSEVDADIKTMTIAASSTISGSNTGDNAVNTLYSGLVTEDKHAVIQVACSDLVTAITTGTSKGYFRMPYAMTVTDVRVSLLDAGTVTGVTIDINEAGTTILSTKLTTDATEATSETAATAAVISDTALADDAVITFDFDAVPTAGLGVIVTIIGTRN